MTSSGSSSVDLRGATHKYFVYPFFAYFKCIYQLHANAWVSVTLAVSIFILKSVFIIYHLKGLSFKSTVFTRAIKYVSAHLPDGIKYS